MLSVQRVTLTRYITIKGLQALVNRLECANDCHILPTAHPNYQVQARREHDPQLQFPAIWRDAITANVEMKCGPDWRHLTI
ncbi:unnamed protein product [Pieris brassicae]|uniref:Uncharacterized protein n=1 Tax=Pieris brassicae TaxID=7116 RepID=A0A9P0TW11_PIEBR|nr:unnamed protein product [Pieris brassicae]